MTKKQVGLLFGGRSGEGFGALGILGERVAHLEFSRGGGVFSQILPRGELNGSAHQGFMGKSYRRGSLVVGLVS